MMSSVGDRFRGFRGKSGLLTHIVPGDASCSQFRAGTCICFTNWHASLYCFPPLLMHCLVRTIKPFSVMCRNSSFDLSLFNAIDLCPWCGVSSPCPVLSLFSGLLGGSGSQWFGSLSQSHFWQVCPPLRSTAPNYKWITVLSHSPPPHLSPWGDWALLNLRAHTHTQSIYTLCSLGTLAEEKQQ